MVGRCYIVLVSGSGRDVRSLFTNSRVQINTLRGVLVDEFEQRYIHYDDSLEVGNVGLKRAFWRVQREKLCSR